MNWTAALQTIVSNLIVASIVAVVGFLIWRWQTIFKRRYEVAEQALIKFAQAEEVLTDLRRFRPAPMSEPKPPEALANEEKRYFRAWQRVLADLTASKSVEDDLVSLARLCRFHLGAQAEKCIWRLHFAFHEIRSEHAKFSVWVSMKELKFDENFKAIETAYRNSEAFIGLPGSTKAFIGLPRSTGRSDEENIITREVKAVRAELEAICAKYHDVNIFRLMLGIPRK